MKIIEHIPILGMAYQRSKAIDEISKYDDPIHENIIKSVVYGNSTGNLHHWIYDELATWFDAVNHVLVKGTKSGKLKEKDYVDNTFGFFGEDFNDASVGLQIFYDIQVQYKQKYPEFEITYEIQRNVFDAYQNILSKFPKIFSQRNNFSKNDFARMLWEILGE
jgi:hypothetical protein